MPERTSGTSASVAIAATFTAEPIKQPLDFLLQEAGLALALNFAPYNQVLQELVSHSSALAINPLGVNVLFVRFEDIVRDITDPVEARSLISRTADELLGLLNLFVGRCKTPVILAAFQASPEVRDEIVEAIDFATAHLLVQAAALPGVFVLDSNDIDALAVGERYDSDSNDLAHIPFTESYFAAIALALTRRIHALRVPDRKVLVLDCDNTIWRGVVGEDGVDGITIPPAFAALQKFAIAAQAKGILICLASKNVESDVLAVLEQRPDMLLKLDHIVAHKINWNPKPQNVVALARELNLGLDAFVFVDDNPVECELMRTEIPQVLTLQLPPDEQIESFLSHLWVFDKIAVTNEDTRRTSMYKEEAARKQLEHSAVDIVDFVSSLKVKVDINSPNESEWPRLAQLTSRTNQFNFTTARRSEGELRALQGSAAGWSVLRVNVSDRFGDYGLVGLVICHASSEALIVDTFLLSCRVLGRGVEHSILRHLGALARQLHLEEVLLPFKRSARNEPAWAFAESVAAQFRADEEAGQVYRIPTDQAVGILHRPGQDPEAVIKARESGNKKVAPPTISADLTERYTTFAQKLLTSEDVLAAAKKVDLKARTLPGLAVPPRDATERQMLVLWQEVLGITDLGIDDDYAALGGTSLLAARLFASISNRFGIKLPLTSILEHSTVRRLAALVSVQNVAAKTLVDLRSGGSKSIFFVYDGDGETLLYLNIARRLPATFSIFGIEPLRLENVPLAHTRIEDMAAYCVGALRSKQPKGPYIIGGMCAGGVIAYEMARQLQIDGEVVQRVVLLDAARPAASKRKGRIAQQRKGRLSQLISGDGQKPDIAKLSLLVTRKLINAAIWEIDSRIRRLSVRARFKLLSMLLLRRRGWPSLIPPLNVRQIYDSAELSYRAPPSSLPVLLIRARVGQGGDAPFREVYSDESLGWAEVVRDLIIDDVDGGHFSMLQEPHAAMLAKKIADRLASEIEVAEPASMTILKVNAA
jgi:FkbH-like protein